MAKLSRALAAYVQSKKMRTPPETRYFSYTGVNMMGLHIDDIFSAHDENELRDKLQKQFVKVETVREISSQLYQTLFEKKRDTVVAKGKELARTNEALRQKQLDEGTVDPEEELEHFMDRLKKRMNDN